MPDAENDPTGEPQQTADPPAPPPQDEAPPPDESPFDPPFMDSVQGSDDFPPPPSHKR